MNSMPSNAYTPKIQVLENLLFLLVLGAALSICWPQTDHIGVVLHNWTTGRIGTFDLAANALAGAIGAVQR